MRPWLPGLRSPRGGSGAQAGLVLSHIMTGSEIALGLVQTASQKRAESRTLKGEAVTQPTCGLIGQVNLAWSPFEREATGPVAIT